jgi:hypothetical protein
LLIPVGEDIVRLTEMKPMNAPKKLLVSTLALALSLPALAAAADSGSYGYFRVVEGSAILTQAGTDERSNAEINQPVLAGDRIWVPDRSRIEIVLADRNILRLDGGSEIVLERLAASPDRDDRATVLRLLEGNLQLVVTQDALGDELPRIDTPNATIYPRDVGVYRVTAERDGWSEVVVRRGTAEVATDRGTARVRADEEAVIDGDRYAGAEVREAGGFDSLERWARQLDDDYAAADLRYVDDDLRYEAAPLARYGSWIEVGGSPYWRPRVAAGWRPYFNGRWIYTPAGLTWLSAEPWGWVPYHYGTWDYLPGYGWVWQPGYVWAPAWVYWYWGPSYVGWCPTGYYTRYYGPRLGLGFGFRFGVYGWAGGDWRVFDHWSFVRTSYFGSRQGSRDRYWDGRRDVRRFAVPIDSSVRGALERGVITTDTKPLRPNTWASHQGVLRALQAERNGARGAELPDVTSFIARKPLLPATVTRTVRAAGKPDALDGTPLKPSTLGRSARRAAPRDAEPGNADWADRIGSKPRIVLGGDGAAASATGSRPTGRETPQVRSARPVPEANSGATRPRRVEIYGAGQTGWDSSPPAREARPANRGDAEERRPPVDREQIQRDIALRRQAERQDTYVRPQDTDRTSRPDLYRRPAPSAQPDRYRQPEPRVIEPAYRGPEPSRRPESPRYEQGNEPRPAPSLQPRSRPDTPSVRQPPPQRSRGDQGAHSQPRQRQARPREDGDRDHH